MLFFGMRNQQVKTCLYTYGTIKTVSSLGGLM